MSLSPISVTFYEKNQTAKRLKNSAGHKKQRISLNGFSAEDKDLYKIAFKGKATTQKPKETCWSKKYYVVLLVQDSKTNETRFIQANRNSLLKRLGLESEKNLPKSNDFTEIVHRRIEEIQKSKEEPKKPEGAKPQDSSRPRQVSIDTTEKETVKETIISKDKELTITVTTTEEQSKPVKNSEPQSTEKEDQKPSDKAEVSADDLLAKANAEDSSKEPVKEDKSKDKETSKKEDQKPSDKAEVSVDDYLAPANIEDSSKKKASSKEDPLSQDKSADDLAKQAAQKEAELKAEQEANAQKKTEEAEAPKPVEKPKEEPAPTQTYNLSWIDPDSKEKVSATWSGHLQKLRLHHHMSFKQEKGDPLKAPLKDITFENPKGTSFYECPAVETQGIPLLPSITDLSPEQLEKGNPQDKFVCIDPKGKLSRVQFHDVISQTQWYMPKTINVEVDGKKATLTYNYLYQLSLPEAWVTFDKKETPEQVATNKITVTDKAIANGIKITYDLGQGPQKGTTDDNIRGVSKTVVLTSEGKLLKLETKACKALDSDDETEEVEPIKPVEKLRGEQDPILTYNLSWIDPNLKAKVSATWSGSLQDLFSQDHITIKQKQGDPLKITLKEITFENPKGTSIYVTGSAFKQGSPVLFASTTDISLEQLKKANRKQEFAYIDPSGKFRKGEVSEIYKDIKEHMPKTINVEVDGKKATLTYNYLYQLQLSYIYVTFDKQEEPVEVAVDDIVVTDKTIVNGTKVTYDLGHGPEIGTTVERITAFSIEYGFGSIVVISSEGKIHRRVNIKDHKVSLVSDVEKEAKLDNPASDL